MQIINSIFKNLFTINAKQIKIEAIWLQKPLLTPNGSTKRLVPETVVCVKDGELVDGTEATHKIASCWGTVLSVNLEVSVIDLKTLELSRIKIPHE